MRGLTTYLQAKGGSLLAAGLLVLVGAGAVLGVGIGLGSGVFDPSGFLGAGTDRQKEASLDAAFGIDQTESEGEATMEADEQEKPESPVPDVKDFNAVDYVPGNTGLSALSIVDGPAQGTLPGGNAGGEGSGGAGSGGAVGPVVDGEGDGASPDDPGPGPGPGPGPTPADPDPVVPELPSGLYEDMFDEPLPSFPEEGFVPAVPGDPEPEVDFMVVTESDGMGTFGMQSVYYGQVLTDWKLLCSTCCYLIVDGVQYRLSEFGPNFQVGSYPQVVEQDGNLEVEFRVRLNEQSPWMVETARFEVRPYKVYVEDWNGGYLGDGSDSGDVFYPDPDNDDLVPYVDLAFLSREMLPEELRDESLFSPVTLSAYFAGWSETEGGALVDPCYLPSRKGLTILKPLPLRPVPPGYEISFDYYQFSLPGSQVLTGYPEGAAVLDVPAGIDAVDLLSFDSIVFDQVIVPASVTVLNIVAFGDQEVRQAWQVDEGNPVYRSHEGMLLTREDAAIIGVPTSKRSIDVPAETPSVALPENNALAEVRLHAAEPPQIDLALLHGATIIVPDEHYVTYLQAWGPRLQDNVLVAASGTTPDYYLQDGALLSVGADGSVMLERVMPDAAGIYVVPEDVVSVKAGALDGCAQVEALVLPQGVRRLEGGCFSGAPGLARVLFQGLTPPDVEGGAFGPETKAVVVPDARAAYERAWGAVLGDGQVASLLVASAFELREVNGFAILAEPEGSVLLRAPADVERFDERLLGGVEVSAVNAHAFKECAQLWLAELPSSVRSIGREAFEGCTSLEAFYAHAPGTISVDSGAFEGCDALRFAVFEAAEASFADSDELAFAFPGYALRGAAGYPADAFDRDNSAFHLAEQGNGVLLYANKSSDATVSSWCLSKATLNASGSVPADGRVTSIGSGAFSGCAGITSFDFAGARSLHVIGDAAFFDSGLAGGIVIPGNVFSIGDGAFTSCQALESVHIEGSRMDELGMAVFSGCSSLARVTFGAACAITEMGESVFAGTALEEVELPAALRTLPAEAFADCPNLVSVSLPASLEDLWTGAFNRCPSLASVTVRGPVPPRLGFYWGSPFSFGEGFPEGFRVVLAGAAAGHEDEYVDAWKYSMVARDATQGPLPPDLEQAGSNAVRAVLGLALVEGPAVEAEELAAEAERPADGAAEPVVEAAGTEPPPAAGTEPPAAPDDRSSAEALPEGD